ncbi:MAG: Asp-tRNA(Asn)/Glu-tRNA(Gln) amidotransferase subunit GatC, partial [Clostridia bacterium]|nr:Asp-tRNA(Asn)/Glu-tRNA(Gln) amidotransferase subunit GatC [Clostridia bacterium]
DMDKIEHLEYLSKLEFTGEEKEKFENEFENILKFVDEIANLDLPEGLDKDEPITLNELRVDEPQESIPQEVALQNAPKQKDGCYLTPLVVE